MNAQRELRAFRRAFAAAGTNKRAEGEKKYLKSALSFHGVTVPFIRKAAKQFRREHAELSRAELVELVEALWKTRYHDLHSLAIALLGEYQGLLVAKDLALVASLLRRSSTWDHVDWLSTSVAGSLVGRYPRLERTLVRWAEDDVFWIRRAALLALLLPLRRGEGNFDLFAQLASTMVEEREFFIRKAIGWVLREVSKKRPALAHAFLREHVDRVSGLTLREGSKYLPVAQRERLSKAYKARKK